MPSGFFYSVKALVDKASFEDGIRELEKLEQSSKRMMKGIAGIAAGAVSAATIAGQVAQQELKVAQAIGTSTEALSSWKIAANVAGASASGLIGTLVNLENKMQHLKTGQVDIGLAKNLGLLNLNYGDFAKMSAEDRMRSVFNQADKMEDQKLAATLVGDILGQAGREYYDTLKMSGKSFEEQVAEARKLNFVTEKNRKEASIFAMEMRGVKEAGKSITTLLGSEIGAALTPQVRRIKNYLIENKTQIQKGIQGVARTTATVFDLIAGAIGKIEPVVKNLIDRFGGLDQVIIKVGLGFASFKFVQFAGGLRSILTGVNLLKVAIGGIGKGLIGGALYLIFDDIITHFQGGKSVIFDKIIPAIQDLKKELGFDDVDFSGFVRGLEQVITQLEKLAGSQIKNTLMLFKDLADLITNLITGDFNKVGENIKKFFKDYKEGLNLLFGMNSEDFNKGKEEAAENGANPVGQFIAGAGTAIEGSPIGKVGKVFSKIPGVEPTINFVADKIDTATGLKQKEPKPKKNKKEKAEPGENKNFFVRSAEAVANFVTGNKAAKKTEETPAVKTEIQTVTKNIEGTPTAKKDNAATEKIVEPKKAADKTQIEKTKETNKLVEKSSTKTIVEKPEKAQTISPAKKTSDPQKEKTVEKLTTNSKTEKVVEKLTTDSKTEKGVEKQPAEKIAGKTEPKAEEKKEEKGGIFRAIKNFILPEKKEPEEKVGAKINDGVISPDGKITSVSPDDWLIAVRNIEDLAGAFMPNQVMNTTSSSETNVTINQSFTMQHGNDTELGSSIFEKAYKGTAEALKQTLKTSALNLQLIPGTR